MSELFGGASDFSSSGIDSLADAQYSYDDNRAQTVADNQAEEAISNILANVGNRSNIRGSTNYNPIFAQALNMSGGLQPGNRVAGDYYGANNFQGITDLARPSYLQPQLRGADGTMYFSEGERFLQETLPPIIEGARKLSPTGIIQTLIKQGQDAYNKGKGFLEETFEPEKKSDIGIMENMNRSEANDIQRALMAGYDNSRMNPVQIDPNTQTAMSLRDVQNFITSPDVVGKGLSYAEPYIQKLLPEGLNFDAGSVYNEEEQEFQPRIQFTIPFSTG
tara:strand:- start:1123 stop:1953 length:831 start_codon:yes stop_codon:yes gene_type:complete